MRSMHIIYRVILTISIFWVVWCSAAAAAELVVEVLDNTGDPVAGATVNATGKAFKNHSPTDEAGYAFFRDVPKIIVDITVGLEGFTQESAVVDMRLNRSREVKVVLTQVVGLEELLNLPSP